MTKLHNALPMLLLGCLLALPVNASALTDPHWDQLDTEQQTVMAPLAGEWDRYAPEKKKSLLAIVPEYRSLDAAGKLRLQSKLKIWSDLTLEQRQQIRNNWKVLQGLPPTEREKAIQRLKQGSSKPQASG